MTTDVEQPKTATGVPLQLTSYAEKIANDNAMVKQTIDCYINQASWNREVGRGHDMPMKMSDLADAYNNRISSKLFDYTINPYNSKNPKYQHYPARLRPYNILRQSIDLLCGEWNKRGFRFDVVNADGEDTFNSFLFAKEQAFKSNIEQRFINTINQTKDSGLPSEEIPNPKTVIVDLNNNYKDEKALRGYRALKVIELEKKLPELWEDLFKDWLLYGEIRTYKLPKFGDIEYDGLSPIWVDTDTAKYHKNIEDREWAVAYFRLDASTIVDMFHREMTKDDIEDINGTDILANQYNTFLGLQANQGAEVGTVEAYYVCYKSKKRVGLLTYHDPFTGELVMDLVDEDYKPDKELEESVEWWWVNETWHGWRIGKDKYFSLGPVAAQRNEMNNFSSCKLPINGVNFSDTDSDNVSLTFLGMPYQILYIIMMYRIELTIARSKGKIALMDRNAIPAAEEEDQGEEQYLWYAEATGWAFIDRSQKGVDRNFNQYQVLDFSLYNDIKQLIGIAEWIKSQWEELIGITRPRKGEGDASTGLGVTQTQIFRGSVISDIIFSKFESFLETELQGLLDLSKFAWIDGKKGNYRNDDGRMEFLAIEPEDHLSSDYSVFAIKSSKYVEKLRILQEQINAVAQRKDVKLSTIVELIWTESITDLKAQLRQAEAVETETIARVQKSETEKQKDFEELKRQYDLFQHFLDVDLMEKTKDRDEIIAYIKKGNSEGIEATTDVGEIHKQATEIRKLLEEERKNRTAEGLERDKIKAKLFEIRTKNEMNKRDNTTALKNKVVGEK